jgi:lysophospholipase L1-like esterase
VNAALAARYGSGAAAGVTYIDVTPLFMSHGAVDTSLFYDPKLAPPEPPLHPTPDGMARIAEAIEPMLSAMLGDRRH